MKILKLWEVALERQMLAMPADGFKELLKYGIEREKDVVIFNDAVLEGEEKERKKEKNLQFFTGSLRMLQKIKKAIEECGRGFQIKADTFLSMKESPQTVFILNVTADMDELKDALSTSKNPDCISISKALSQKSISL